MSTKRIVATGPIGETAIQILEEIAPVETAPAQDEETLMSFCENTIAFVSRGTGAVTGRMIAASPDLAVIGRPGAGYDTVDVAAATARGIPVVYAPVSGFAVAEGALALLMALVKRLPECDRAVKAGRWQDRFGLTTGDMTEHTLGLIGFGRIGQGLARLVAPFEMMVLAHDPYASAEAAAELGAQLVGLDELLSRSDYVSIHAPLTDETRGMMSAARIASMKAGAILVNTSRGDTIESLDVLADALDSGQLAAVGLDVFSDEPPDSAHRIFEHPRCLCAPHVVGVSVLGMERIYRTMATGMVAVFNGERPEFCVNPEIFG